MKYDYMKYDLPSALQDSTIKTAEGVAAAIALINFDGKLCDAKELLKNRYNWSKNKVRRTISELEEIGIIDTLEMRDNNGRFIGKKIVFHMSI